MWHRWIDASGPGAGWTTSSGVTASRGSAFAVRGPALGSRVRGLSSAARRPFGKFLEAAVSGAWSLERRERPCINFSASSTRGLARIWRQPVMAACHDAASQCRGCGGAQSEPTGSTGPFRAAMTGFVRAAHRLREIYPEVDLSDWALPGTMLAVAPGHPAREIRRRAGGGAEGSGCTGCGSSARGGAGPAPRSCVRRASAGGGRESPGRAAVRHPGHAGGDPPGGGTRHPRGSARGRGFPGPGRDWHGP